MRRNINVLKKKRQEVLRRRPRGESSQQTPQHLSAKKRSRSVTVKKRLAPPELATLINLINQVPDGLPSLRELRQMAREWSNAELGLRGPVAYGGPDRLDRLIFQTIEQKAPALLSGLPALPDMSDPRSRLPWIANGIQGPGRAQLLYRYEYLVEGRLALSVIADTDNECIGPFHFEQCLHFGDDGKLKVKSHPILEMLCVVDRKRIRRCPICAKIYWSERIDQPACSKACNNRRRSRIFRGTLQPS
jgi:hypothetical protein